MVWIKVLLLISLLSVAFGCRDVKCPEQKKKEKDGNDCPYQPSPQTLDAADIKALDPVIANISQYVSSLVDEVIRPAISANLVYRDTVIWSGNFGKLNKTTTEAPTGDTIYRMASISKIFPTLFLFKLAEEGKVNIHDPVTKYAPNFRIERPHGSTKEITLFDLASQISGLPSQLPYDLSGGSAAAFAWNGTLEQTLELIANQILVAEPKTTCYYSNQAYALLGHVLARNFTVDDDFESWAKANIVDTLKLNNTGFVLDSTVKSIMATGYYQTGAVAPLVDLHWFRPAGNYYSSANDLAILAQSFMEMTKERVLKHNTLLDILNPVMKCGFGYLSERTGSPWEVNEQQTYLVIRKDGDIDGYSSTMAMVPKLKLAFNVMMSGGRPSDIARTVLDTVIPPLVHVLRTKPVPLKPAHQPTKYIGLYRLLNLQTWNVTAYENDSLVMTNPNIPSSPFKTVGLSFTSEDTAELTILGGEFPCMVGTSNLEVQNGALVHFTNFSGGVFNQLNFPSLNLYEFVRVTA